MINLIRTYIAEAIDIYGKVEPYCNFFPNEKELLNIKTEVFTFGKEIEKIIVLLTEVMLIEISLIVVDDGFLFIRIFIQLIIIKKYKIIIGVKDK